MGTWEIFLESNTKNGQTRKKVRELEEELISVKKQLLSAEKEKEYFERELEIKRFTLHGKGRA